MSGGGGVVDEMNTAVPDREDRKNIRRKRIDKRNAKDDDNNSSLDANRNYTTTSGAQQVADSFLHLDRKKSKGLKDVTQSRIVIDKEEAQRRGKDEVLRRDRLTKLQREALTSAKANAAIEMKWAELLEKDIPQELHHEIKTQMDACQRVIVSKDDIITEFQKHLRAKDEEYVKNLRSQAEDVEHLLSRIRSEFGDLSAEYDKELEAIEDAYLSERDQFISEQSSEIDSLFETRKSNETNYKENKQKREDQCQREIEDLLTQGADKYNKLKIELEMNIQTLKQQLEEIKATYQLNTEKLDYNYRVLTELDVEKNAELARYKRRLTRLKDQLNFFVNKFHEMEISETKSNNDLTDDYRRLTSKYKNLQSKFRHFEVSDTHKYEEIWSMHDEEAKDMVDQLLKADKILTEQQLGMMWNMPADLSLLTGGMKGGVAPGTPAPIAEEHDDSKKKEKEGRKVSGARIRAMLKLLATEGSFMLNTAVQESIDSLPDEEADLSRAEAMLKVLGVKSEEKMAQLVNYFFSDTMQGDMVVAQRDRESSVEPIEGEHTFGIGIDMDPHDLVEVKTLLTPEDVIAACKTFIEDSSDAPIGGAAASDGATKRRQQAMKQYWDNLAQVVSDESIGIWKQLETDASKLQEIINRRSNAIASVDTLNVKNAKLKQLLNQYLGDRKNDMMQVPPAQTMRVRNVGKQKSSGAKTGGLKGKDPSSKLMSATQ